MSYRKVWYSRKFSIYIGFALREFLKLTAFTLASVRPLTQQRACGFGALAFYLNLLMAYKIYMHTMYICSTTCYEIYIFAKMNESLQTSSPKKLSKCWERNKGHV